MRIKQKVGIFFITAGILFIAAALIFCGYNYYCSYIAQNSAKSALDNLNSHLNTLDRVSQMPDYIIDPDMDMPELEKDGEKYIGVLKIPALELELPIISEQSLKSLRKAPCRYKGSVYNDSMIIAAHNYRSHFGRLNLLQIGDSASFTDINGNQFNFKVVSVETLSGTAVSEMENGNPSLTLFTCTLSGKSRVTVRFEKIN